MEWDQFSRTSEQRGRQLEDPCAFLVTVATAVLGRRTTMGMLMWLASANPAALTTRDFVRAGSLKGPFSFVLKYVLGFWWKWPEGEWWRRQA